LPLEAPNSPEKHPYHHGDLRAALIAAALQLIERHGVKGFTLKDAARIAGVSVAAPYRHFADREALLEAIQQEGFATFNAALASAGKDAETPRAHLIELGIAYLRFALQHPVHFRVMFSMAGDPKPKSPPDPHADPDGYALLVAAVAAVDPAAPICNQHDLVLACWSVVHGYASLYLDGAFAFTALGTDPETQLRRALTRFIAPP